jgi:hypothetical protein
LHRLDVLLGYNCGFASPSSNLVFPLGALGTKSKPAAGYYRSYAEDCYVAGPADINTMFLACNLTTTGNILRRIRAAFGEGALHFQQI